MKTARSLLLSNAAILVSLLGCLVLASTARADAMDGITDPFAQALATGSYGMALALVFAAGIATSFTPCVYPMIIITVSVFGAREAQTKRQGAMLSTSFVLGIAALFTPLGIVAAVTGSVFGEALAHPAVLIGLAGLFVALALSMFGAFELNLPPALQNRLAQVGGVGIKGAFALGLVSAVIAAPCTGPVLAALLAWVANTGNVAFGGLSLFVYALGLGLLFWVVGTFAVGLPKSGRWLEWVKSFFGIVMLVMALYYLRPLLPVELPSEQSTLFIAISGASLALGLLAGAIHLPYHGATRARVAQKTAAIALAVLGAFGIVGWMNALPPGAKIAWLEDYEAGKAKALALGKPLMVDFGADWCGQCGELDRNTFTDPRVVAKSREFVAVKVDMSADKISDEKRAILASYEQRGLPLVVFHHSNGQEAERLLTFAPPDQFLALMEKAR